MKKIGLIGFGYIGQYIYNRNKANPLFDVDFIVDPVTDNTKDVSDAFVAADIKDALERKVDLVIEVAHADVIKNHGADILALNNLLIISVTALSDDSVKTTLEETAGKNGTQIFMCHGAITAIDGIQDGRELLTSVIIETTKHPRNLGLNPDDYQEKTVLFEGPTREACIRFPRNVNVHATVAAAGMGFDKTISKITADPETDKMKHDIYVEGESISWHIKIASAAKSKVSGVYTPESVYQTVCRYCVTKTLSVL